MEWLAGRAGQVEPRRSKVVQNRQDWQERIGEKESFNGQKEK